MKQDLRVLREYFASCARQGLLAGGRAPTNPQELSQEAYRIADAMIEARENPREGDGNGQTMSGPGLAKA